jgi:hypothetical protein
MSAGCGGGGDDARDVIHVSNFPVLGGSTVSFIFIIYAIPVVAAISVVRSRRLVVFTIYVPSSMSRDSSPASINSPWQVFRALSKPIPRLAHECALISHKEQSAVSVTRAVRSRAEKRTRPAAEPAYECYSLNRHNAQGRSTSGKRKAEIP